MLSSTPTKIHWSSVLQFTLSTLTIFGLWGMAVSLIVFGVTLRSDQTIAIVDPTSLALFASSLLFSGLLVAPSAIYALLHSMGRTDVSKHTGYWFLRPGFLILFFPFIVFAGQWMIDNTQSASIILPPLHVLAVGLPVSWLAYLGYRNLTTPSRQRTWGIFSSGLVLGPLITILVEIGVVIIGLILVMLYLASKPELANELSTLAQRLIYASTSPQIVQRILRPYLSLPGLVYPLIAFFVIVVPLIEELIKPIGVWLLAGHRLTPAEGFVTGVLSGAGFALFENLLYGSNVDAWSFFVTARIGTAAMHILTAGLTGWALTLTWRDRKYFRLAITYLTSVLIHGIWNGFSIVGLAAQLFTPSGWLSTTLNFAATTTVAQIVLGLTFMIMLFWFNHLLRAAEPMRISFSQIGSVSEDHIDE